MGNMFLDNFLQVPVNKLFGYTLISRSSQEAVISMEARPEYAQEAGVVQGGIISAIADTAAVYAFLPDLDEGQLMTSIEFKINFVRPVEPKSGPIVARSKIVKRGQTVGVCEVEVTQSENLVAKGLFTYLFFEQNG